MKKHRIMSIFLLIILISKNITYASTTETSKSNYDSSIQYYEQLDGNIQEKYNCGPAVLKMVFSIFDKKTEVSYEEIRKIAGNESKGLYTTEVKKALDAYKIPYSEKSYINPEQLIEIIDNGDIAILCIDMGEIEHIRTEECFWGKNTETLKTGHYILLTGYRYKEGKVYFEVLDPYNRKIGTKYTYNPLNYYESSCLEKAIKNWYTKVLIIDK